MYTTPTGGGAYPHMSQLMEIERRRSKHPPPMWLQTVSTPLVRREWARDLEVHPDHRFKSYILNGITHGFHIGFDYEHHQCRSAVSNMQSAVMHARVVREYLEEEVSLGRLVGPVPSALLPSGTQISAFGVIPKSGRPGRWRLIVDLSSPEGASVNAGIEPELCSLHYLQLDEVTRQIAKLGKGTQVAKMDIESAYRMVPVHPEDRPLLAVQWAGQTFFDTRLPFGLRSAPMIFSAVADALQWSFRRQGVTWVSHYLDDFITLGPPGTATCQSNLEQMLSSCARLGVPVAPGKCVGPATVLVFLGFELDTEEMIVRLPQEKLQRTMSLVQEWMSKKGCRKKELESLLGHLQHAATVVRPGRTFVRRVIELLARFRRDDHWIRLNAATRSDLMWWQKYMEGWNGISMMPKVAPMANPLQSDASGSWGCGAVWGSQWFQWAWEGPSKEWAIAPKELLPILFAMVVWGRQWCGQRVICQCDNAAVVAVINTGRAKDTVLMHLLRCMFFVAAQLHLHIQATHVPGCTNLAADALSRNDFARFLQVVPQATRDPEAIPKTLVELVVMEQPDWTSARWAQLFSVFCRQV